MSTTLEDAINWARRSTGESTEVDEAAAREALTQAKANAEAALAAAQSQAAGEAKERDQATAGKQAIFDAVYAVAAADGSVTPVEQAQMVIGLSSMLGQSYDETSILDALATAKALFDSDGVEGIAKSAAAAVPERDGRASLLVLASSVAWLGGGVGVKEGLALQALAHAFDIAINDLHRLMVVGKIA